MSDRARQQQLSDSEIDLLELPFGLFTVGETGKVSFDLLFENNRVGGDLGFFRLEGMESLEVDSVEFKREAIRRTTSQSALGRSIFSDRTSIDTTPKTQTVQMNPGETFALVFFPKSSEGAIANPTPILSLHAGKFADVGDGCTVAMDIAESSEIDTLTGQVERPYTDLIFRVEGATGQLEKLDGLVTSEQDWRATSFGKEILSITSKFVVEIQEQNSVRIEEIETEAIDLFEVGELETDSGFESRIFNESNEEREKGDREISDNLSQGDSGKDRSEIESESHFGDAIEIEENSSSSYSTKEPIEEEVETTRSPSSQLESTQKIPDHPFASGVFTVEETGEVGIDFLFDGGKYKSELAIFNLEGMGEYEFGSTEFIEEASKRALSNSKLGYVVIQDRDEGAKFEGELGEKSWNKGEYKGIKMFQMEAGTQFGIMLIPNGTVKQVNNKPKIGGAKKPLFSMALAGKDYGQIADLNGEGHTFAMEDVQPTHKWFDRDYNDIIFQVKGATGTAQLFDNALNPEKDWRPTPLGQEILEYIKTPDRAPEHLRLFGDRLHNPGESFSFSGWVMDADGGADIDRVDLWLQKDGGEWQDIDDATDFSVNGDRAFFHHELGALDPGRYRLKAIPRDRGGTEGEAYEQTVTVLGDKLSHRVKWAIERSMNLESYDPQALQATQKWLVSVRSGSSSLQLAEQLGAQNLGTGRIPNTHTWEFPQGTDPRAIADLLAETVGIEYAYPLVAKEVEFYNTPASEPLVADDSQWHLHSNGQFDANITETWTKHGVYGNNVTVGIVDGGFSVKDSHNETHPEFLANYRQALSRDFDERDDVPSGLLRGTAELPRESTIFPYQWSVNHTLRSLVLGTIERLSVEVEIDHPDIPSLDVKLVSPNGDRIALHLDGDGEFEGELTAFNGQIANGDWKLEIVNPQHIGFIKEFRLNFTTENDHGTKVAGVAVADGRNNLGGSGVAPDAEKAFLRLGSDGLTSEEVQLGLTHKAHQIDIFNSSWGLANIFDVLPGGEIALEYGAKQGRNGLGNVHLFAAGNNQKDDWGVNRYGNVNYNAFANSRHTIAVGAIDHTGVQAGYSAPGASLIVAAHSNSGKKDSSDRPIVTTKRYSDDGNDDNDYTIRSYSEVGEDFGGTSSATPLVSGVVALMLEANPNLTARDVQAILIETAQKNDPNDSDWMQNDAGYWVNHKYGFGAVDADAAVDLAKNWVSLAQEQMVWGKARSGEFIPDLEDPNDLKPLTSEIEISPATDLAVEWVEIEFVGNHQYLGDLEIVLISPEGTRSRLAEQHYDEKKYGGSDRTSNTYHWFFTSVRHWGESATGKWTLQVTDKNTKHPGSWDPQEAHHANILTSWQINLYGTEPNTPPEASPLNQSHTYTEDVPLALTPIFVTDADGDNITAVLQLSDANAGELRSGSAISNNGILTLSGSIDQINALLSTVEFVPTEHFNGNLVVETSVTDGKIGVPLQGEIELTGIPVNDAPMLEEVALSGAIAGQSLTITYADLLAASNATDVEGDAIAFVIEALNSGTLTQNGNAIALGTQISEGDVLEWTPDGSGDDISAFSIKATDGIDASANAIDVTVDVASPLNTAPELSAIATLTGATTGQPYTITHADLLGASNAVDTDGDAIAFVIESLLSGSLTVNGNAVNVGDEVTATDTLVWTPDSAGDDMAAFTVKASDGQATSGNAVSVNIAVADPSDPVRKIGGEFQVNTYTDNDQILPTVASLKDGGFVVTWTSRGQDGSDNGVYAQRYDNQSNPVGNEFQVNSYIISQQYDSSVTALEDGGFLITWSSPQDGSSWGIYAQRYDSQSNPIGNEFQANSYIDLDQFSGTVTALKDGGFLIIWNSEDQDGSNYGVYAQRYDSQSNLVGDEFQVNSYTNNSQYSPSVTALEDGGFLVAWQSDGQDGNRHGIYAQRYDSQSNPIGNEFQVNSYTTYAQQNPDVTVLKDGGFLIAWNSYRQDGSGRGVYAQRYDSESNPVGNEFRVNSFVNNSQMDPDITALDDGGFLITWTSDDQDGSSTGIYAQRYDSESNPVGNEFRVNSVTDGFQWHPSITTLESGDVIITWDSYDGHDQGIFAQRFSIDTLAGNIVTNTKDSGAGSLRAAIEWANANPGTDTITFDIPTTDPGYNAATGTFTIQPLSALPEITDAIAIDATTQTGFTDKPIIELDGSLAGDGVNGLALNASDSTVQGFVINSFNNGGLFVLGENNKIVGNYIGTDVTGTIDRGNQGAGISGYGSGHIIGGEAESDRNLISGNKYGGIYVSMTDIQVINNYIGTDITGTQDLGNTFGVRFHHFPNNTLKNNVISGNDGHGVWFDGNGSENNILQGNYIGTSADGMSAIANNGNGIILTTSTNNTIGGTTPETRNLISGNTKSGLEIGKFNTFSSTGNQVYGNYIGTDITGTQSLGNGTFGIKVRSYDNAIGGTNAGEGNLISGNTLDGVMLEGENNAIVGNLIGIDKNGINALGNGNDGIQIGKDAGAANQNTISGNAIAFNTKDGIFLNQGIENAFSANNIYNNDGAGIAFKPGYNTNEAQNAPVLAAATVNGATTTVKGTLSETPNTAYRLEFFGNPDNDGEGFTFLGFEEVTTDGSGNTSFNASLSGLVGGQFVTATATDAQGNTSRFSTGVEVELPPLPKQQVTVTVHRIKEVDNMDWGGDADFRTTIGINGTNWTSPIQHNRNDISPNWQFTQDVTGTTIPIALKVQDEDTIFGVETFEDVDVNPQSGNTLHLTYNLLTGEITGSGVNGVAGQQIFVRGGGSGDDRADLWFSIDANTPPSFSQVKPLTGAFAGQEFTITYADLLAASNATDADGEAISFTIDSVTSGTLTKNGTPVSQGDTLAQGESLEWTPDNAGDDVAAFAVKATDGKAVSGDAVKVAIDVATPIAPVYTIGNEFQVNTYTENDQSEPAIAALKNGGFVVAWQSLRQDSNAWEIYAQRYDDNGEQVGEEFLVNSFQDSWQRRPAVAGLDNGDFLITWDSAGQDGDGTGVYAQRYNSNGERIGQEFKVNSITDGWQNRPVITSLKNGEFLIAWMSIGQNDSVYTSTSAHRYNSDGTFGAYLYNKNVYPMVEGLKNGGFITALSPTIGGSPQSQIYIRHYEDNGRLNNSFSVSGVGRNVNMITLEDDGFVIAWESYIPESQSYEIYARHYDSNSNEIGNEFQVNSSTGTDKLNPIVTSLNDGGYIITWTSQGEDGNQGLFAQRYNNIGNKVGNEFQIQSYTQDIQNLSDIVVLQGGSLAIAWESDNQDGSGKGIFAQRFGVAPTTPPALQPAPPSPSVFHHLNHAYNSLQDSPLEEGASIAPLRVETFEDGVLDALGVTASAGSLAPSHSIEDNGNSWQVNQESLTLTFDSDLLGALPTRAGVAVIDIANADISTVAMETFDSQGISLGVTQPEALGMGDRFFGVEYEGGISKVTFTANSNDWNIDHLQYG